MSRPYAFAGSPKWLVGHVIVLAACVTMVLLGRWQLNVSNSKHFDLQNFGYALQWWAFTAFAIGLWIKIIRDNARHRVATSPTAASPSSPTGVSPSSPTGVSPTEQPAEPLAGAGEPVAYRRYVMPQSSSAPPPALDSEQAAYNEYLADLADPSRP